MSRFRTKINVPSSSDKISHGNRVILVGSCFAEHLGNKLKEAKFSVHINPFGITYNPLSIIKQFNRALNEQNYSLEDLKKSGSAFVSLDFHSDFSQVESALALEKMNRALTETRLSLQGCDFLFISMGSAFVYIWKESGEITSNCHRFPAGRFEKQLLSPGEIANHFQDFINSLKKLNPEMTIVFTISPVRHIRDGIQQNTISKSTLFVALNILRSEDPSLGYFPSFELLMDDLRDYRFYDRDLIHPSSEAIDYLWETFGQVYFSNDTLRLNAEISSLRKAILHKPRLPKSDETQQFLRGTLERVQKFEEENMDVSWIEERELIRSRMKMIKGS